MEAISAYELGTSEIVNVCNFLKVYFIYVHFVKDKSYVKMKRQPALLRNVIGYCPEQKNFRIVF